MNNDTDTAKDVASSMLDDIILNTERLEAIEQAVVDLFNVLDDALGPGRAYNIMRTYNDAAHDAWLELAVLLGRLK